MQQRFEVVGVLQEVVDVLLLLSARFLHGLEFFFERACGFARFRATALRFGKRCLGRLLLCALRGERGGLFLVRFVRFRAGDAQAGDSDVERLQLLRQLVGFFAAVLERIARFVRRLLLCGGIRLGGLLCRFERGDLALAPEERAFFMAAAAARHRAARAQELAVHGDDAQAVACRFRDGERVIERVDDERAREQVVGNATETFLRLDKFVAPADDALHPPHAVRIRGLAHLDGRERQECRAAEPLRLQIADGGFRCRGVFRNNVLLTARESDVERRHVFFRHGQEFRDRAGNAAAPQRLRLQHGAHGAAEAFV